MGLLSDMRGYLQRVQAGETTVLAERSAIGREPLRRMLVDAIAEDDACERRIDPRSRDRLLSHPDALISEIIQQIADAPGLTTSEDLPSFVTAGLAAVLRHYSLDPPGSRGSDGLSPVQRSLVDAAAASARAKYTERLEQDVQSPRLYALNLGLVQWIGSRPRLTPLGEVFLRMTGLDAKRWPIAIEILTAVDRDDPWRGHKSLATHLIRHRVLRAHDQDLDVGPGWPWDNPALGRWTAMELLEFAEWEAEARPGEPGGASFTLTELGAHVLEEQLREPDVPLKSLVRAMLEDASDMSLDVAPTRSGGAAASVVRHTRMLAHEMRNALVPVRFAYEQLWNRLPRDEVRVALHRQHTKILEGLDRALRFVTDAARAVSSIAEETTPFPIASALQEACTATTASTGVPIAVTVDPAAVETRLGGPRPRLVMALLNLLRNATQAGGPEVRIAASLALSAGFVAVLTLEDSGPGIPDDRRDRLFENGHSTHAHGSGHGLALVREVVERDFSGSVHYETSALGGARFVLRFPIPSEAT